jgi:hypothetical protein
MGLNIEKLETDIPNRRGALCPFGGAPGFFEAKSSGGTYAPECA